jgi:ATP adenylyltransferase
VERLWTPWRREFVEGGDKTSSACFLCTMPEEDDDRATLILARGDTVYVLLNLYPYNSGHLMVAPYAHGGALATLDVGTAEEVMRMTQRCADVLERAYRPDGCNVGMNLGKAAGAGVPDHLHMHVLPRWEGDTNFMPVIGNTKVLPESLEQTYDRLEPYFRA